MRSWSEGWGVARAVSVGVALALGAVWVASERGEPGVRALIFMFASVGRAAPEMDYAPPAFALVASMALRLFARVQARLSGHFATTR